MVFTTDNKGLANNDTMVGEKKDIDLKDIIN